MFVKENPDTKRRYPVKKWSLQMSQNSQENSFVGCSFDKSCRPTSKALSSANKRNDKCLDSRSYSLFLLMGIFLKHIWQDYKIFTKIVPSQTHFRSSPQRCSVKKAFLKICDILQETYVLEILLNKVPGPLGLQLY